MGKTETETVEISESTLAHLTLPEKEIIDYLANLLDYVAERSIDKVMEGEETAREYLDHGLPICCECGESVAGGSGNYVNRVPVLDDYETRRQMGRPFPQGGWVCARCEAEADECFRREQNG